MGCKPFREAFSRGDEGMATQRRRLKKLSLLILCQERQGVTGCYFFLPAEDLAATAALFFWLALLVLAFFWPDFFCVAFGDLSPITFNLVLRLTRLRHGIFSGGKPIVRCGLRIVNAGANLFAEATDMNFNAVSHAHEQIPPPAAGAGQAFVPNAEDFTARNTSGNRDANH